MMTRINCMIVGFSLLSCSVVAMEKKGRRSELIEQGAQRRSEMIEQGWLERSKLIEQRRRLRSELIAHMKYTVEQVLREYGAA